LATDNPAASGDGRNIRVAAEALYLVNLMLLPGVGFVLLLALYFACAREAPPLARNHLSQTLGVSVIGGVLITVVSGLILLLGESGPYTWLWLVFYFTFIHSSLIFMGVFGFIKAFNHQHFQYPVLGRYFRP